MKKILSLLLLLLLVLPSAEAKRSKGGASTTENSSKEQFRGVWMQTAFQDRFMKLRPEECKDYLTRLVENFEATGFNAILFQVRPEGDAFYQSQYEPWSRFLTGRQGAAPDPLWDPMAFLAMLCHQHHIEFHAWINPFRMTCSKFTIMAENHLYNQHPEWFVKYDDKLYLNPALPECRSHVRQIVKDIVTRYDVDAIHIDDYFYPYPIKGQTFDDKWAFENYAPVMNIDVTAPDALGDFRRRSVNILIKSLHEDIRSIKPWVRFGVSPFGIYRHQSPEYREGSKTTGIQCYDDLYADVLLWAKQGWIDYVIPQLYWEIGHPMADYSTLVKWWNDNTPTQCHLYIGQCIDRSLDDPKDRKPAPNLAKSHMHFSNKLNQASEGKHILGNCFWYAYQVDENLYHVRDFLKKEVFTQPALSPAFKNIDPIAPEKVRNLNIGMSTKGLRVSWQYVLTDDPMQKPRYFCVYKFHQGEKIDISNVSHLYCRTVNACLFDEDTKRSAKYTYVVTSVDALGNESVPVKKSFKVKVK